MAVLGGIDARESKSLHRLKVSSNEWLRMERYGRKNRLSRWILTLNANAERGAVCKEGTPHEMSRSQFNIDYNYRK